MYTDKYWKRRAKKKAPLKKRAIFHLVFAGTLLSILITNYLFITLFSDLMAKITWFIALPLYMGLSYLGGTILLKSKKPMVSFFGVTLIGLPLCSILHACSGGTLTIFIQQVLLTTIISTVLLSIVQILTSTVSIPSWSILAVALSSAVFFNILLIQELSETPLMNWVIVLFIHARLGHVWNKVRETTASIDNAIDGVGILLIESLSPVYYFEVAKKLSHKK